MSIDPKKTAPKTTVNVPPPTQNVYTQVQPATQVGGSLLAAVAPYVMPVIAYVIPVATDYVFVSATTEPQTATTPPPTQVVAAPAPASASPTPSPTGSPVNPHDGNEY